LGIGTTNPNQLLHLSANGPVLALGSSGASDPRIDFYDQNTTTIGAGIFFDQDADSLKILRTVSGSATDGIILNSSGNVGIGTTPSHRLHVVAPDGTLALFSNNSDADLHIKTASAVTLLTPSTGTLALGTSDTERMRIASTGGVLFGPGSSNTVSYTNAAAFSPDGSLSPILIFNTNYAGGTKSNLFFQRNGTTVGSIESTASATSYNTSSDYRLKENVDYEFNALDRVAQLKPARFNFIADETNTLVDGFLAHEVQDIVPEAITGEKDAVDSEGNPKYQGIDQSKLVPLLTKAIQEQQTIIDNLTTRIEALEG
jgi:hypothetical protein